MVKTPEKCIQQTQHFQFELAHANNLELVVHKQSLCLSCIKFLTPVSAPFVHLCVVSRTIELSLQSSLQLSLTVLVCYRIRANI